MTRPTKFEIMRRNRPKVARARKTMREVINQVELEVTAKWEADFERDLQEMTEALTRDREQQLPKPSRLRRIFRAVVPA